MYTHRKIVLNQTEIRLYLPYTDLYGTNQTTVWFQFYRVMVNTIWFRFDLIRFRKKFCPHFQTLVKKCITWPRMQRIANGISYYISYFISIIIWYSYFTRHSELDCDKVFVEGKQPSKVCVWTSKIIILFF